MLNDVRYALRLLRRSPGFAVAAVLTLALGIGANTAIYSVLQAVWIDAVPFANPSRLIVISSSGEFSSTMAVSEEDFADWRARNTAFERLGATRPGGAAAYAGRQIPATWASSELFQVLDGRMHLGRGILPSDSADSAPIVAVVGFRAWLITFRSDPAIVGQTLDSPVGPVEIVGVAPPDFQVSSYLPSLWVSRALRIASPGVSGGRSLQVVGRLKTGVTLEGAAAEMNAIAAALAAERPATNRAWTRVALTPIREKLAGTGVGDSLRLLLAATCVVLLIACANIANLFLARGANRRRELAVRATIGARPVHLVRQILCESTLIAAAGTGAGVLLTMWARDGLVAALPFNLHRASEIAVDLRVLIFTAVVGSLAAVLTGLLPALRHAGASPFDLLAGAAGHSATRARRTLATALVAAEVALAILVLSAATLLVTSFVKLRGVDPGFKPEGLLTFTVRSDAMRAAQDGSLHRRILDALASVPQVQAAAAGEMLPLSGSRSSYPFKVAEGANESDRPTIDLDVRFVSRGYFEVMGIPLKQGRTFAVDGDPPRAVVINEQAARTLWPGRSAVGRQILSPGGGETIIGVVGDVRHVGLDADPVAEVYRPSSTAADLTYVVRTAGSPAALARTVSAAVERAAPVRVAEVSTFDELVDRSVRVPQFRARLFGVMGFLVVSLALIGVFSVTAHAVAERRREIGIRVALGARPSRTVRLVMRQTSTPVMIGMAAGLVLALNTNRLVSHFLFATDPNDGVTLTAVVTSVLATALLAAYIPSRRALRVDPVEALRAE